MKTAPSLEIQEDLYDIINGSRSFPTAKLEYYDKSLLSWLEFKDVESVSITNQSENKQYGKSIFIPSANQASASMVNKRGKYSQGSGGEFDGVLKRNLKVRASVGYVIDTPQNQTYSYNGYGLIKYHSTIETGYYKSDAVGTNQFTELEGIAQLLSYYGVYFYGSISYGFATLWNKYNTNFYGSTYYGFADGYFLSDVIGFEQQDTINTLSLVSDSDKIFVFYRSSPHEEALLNNVGSFKLLGKTANGNNDFDLGDIQDRYFQFCLVFTSGQYGVGKISDINIGYNDRTVDFEQGEFYLDDPSFSTSFGQNGVSFSARDLFKKAFETSISLPTYGNIPYPSGVDLAIIIRDSLDRAKISHNNGSELIPLTGYLTNLADADNWQNVRCIDVLNEIMFYLYSKDSSYRLVRKDGNIALIQVSDDITTADWVVDYRYNMIGFSKSYISDKLIQRATFLSKEHTTDAETSIVSGSYTTTGAKSLSWGNDYMYLRIETTGNATVSNFVIDSAGRTCNFNIDSITGTFTLELFGCKHSSGFTGYFGEQLYYDNAIESDGFTQKIVNRLIKSDAEAQSMANAYISRYGNPTFDAIITLNCNPLLEIGDKLLVWEKYTYSNTIYRIESISINFNASGAQLTQTLNLSDLGITVDPLYFQWDGGNSYDGGFIWDQDLGIENTTDPNTYIPIARF